DNVYTLTAAPVPQLRKSCRFQSNVVRGERLWRELVVREPTSNDTVGGVPLRKQKRAGFPSTIASPAQVVHQRKPDARSELKRLPQRAHGFEGFREQPLGTAPSRVRASKLATGTRNTNSGARRCFRGRMAGKAQNRSSSP